MIPRSIRFSESPWFALDIDGTLGDYHGHFLKCAEMFLQREMPSPDEINPGLPLHKHMRISKMTYRTIKMAYRQGRWKRSMPCFLGARDLSVSLRRNGARIAICTTRPFNQLGEVDADTRWWLRHHGIQHDLLVWGQHKYRDLRKIIGAQTPVLGTLEDMFDLYKQAEEQRMKPMLRDQPYNQAGPWVTWTPDRTYGLFDAKDIFLERLSDWKESNMQLLRSGRQSNG